MPLAPNVDGLPLWLQVVVSLLFGISTLFVAIQGYNKRKPEGAVMLAPAPDDGAMRQAQSAMIVDMAVIRNLATVMSSTCVQLESLEKATREHTYWVRTQHELEREVAARLRELREALEEARHDRQNG